MIKKILCMALLAVGLTACTEGDGPDGSAEELQITVNGTIDVGPNAGDLNREASVSFNRFPKNYKEFTTAYATLKQTPQGAVAAELMAMELYRRKQSDGEKALNLCNLTTNVACQLPHLNDLFGYSGKDDPNYARPYQVASFLAGATPANGYNPTEPYTITMKVNDAGTQYSDDLQAQIIQFAVSSSGTDSGSRTCEVVKTDKPGEPNGWCMVNCPGFYTQCRQKSYSAKFNGLK